VAVGLVNCPLLLVGEAAAAAVKDPPVDVAAAVDDARVRDRDGSDKKVLARAGVYSSSE
jgi:hypothetical protein